MPFGSYAFLVVAARHHVDADQVPLDHRLPGRLRRTCLAGGCPPYRIDGARGRARRGYASQESATNELATSGHARFPLTKSA
jgi:hypothetical protein